MRLTRWGLAEVDAVTWPHDRLSQLRGISSDAKVPLFIAADADDVPFVQVVAPEVQRRLLENVYPPLLAAIRPRLDYKLPRPLVWIPYCKCIGPAKCK